MIAAHTTTERMPIVGVNEVMMTPDETWKMEGEGAYAYAERFAVDKLGSGSGKRKCLVIGSPIPEVRSLAANGWRVSHVDVRNPPEVQGDFIVCDATDLLFENESFDAVSSTCVMCHAGLGRYGDPVKSNGDVLMLREIYRVLKPNGLAVVMPGPTFGDLDRESVVYGTVHRIYRVADLMKMAMDTGFSIESTMMVQADAEPMEGEIKYCYLSMLMRKTT